MGEEDKRTCGFPSEREEILAWHYGPVRNLQISEIDGLPHPEADICMVGEGNSPTTKGEIMVQATPLITLQEVARV